MIAPRSEASEPRRLPFAIEKTIHNILFIKTHMQRQDEFDAVIHLFFLYHHQHIYPQDDFDAVICSSDDDCMADDSIEFAKFDQIELR